MKLNINTAEFHQVCGTGLLSRNTLRRYMHGETVRPVVLCRLKMALQQLGLMDRAPELFRTALGGAANPNPAQVLEPEDVEAEATETSATV